MCLGIPGQIVEISDVRRKLALVEAPIPHRTGPRYC